MYGTRPTIPCTVNQTAPVHNFMNRLPIGMNNYLPHALGNLSGSHMISQVLIRGAGKCVNKLVNTVTDKSTSKVNNGS